MNSEKKLKKPITSFILLTNLIFWPFFCFLGVASSLGFPSWIFDIMFCISAWSSTLAFVALFKKIYPTQTFLQFVKDKFKTKLKPSVILTVCMIQTFIFLMILLLVRTTREEDSIITISSWDALIYFFVKSFLAGPLGEELGWRGFAQIELQKKHSPLIASIIIGFWWGMWHLPIWLTTGFMGFDLLKYSLFFMISILSISIVITAFYNMNKNLFIPIIIHQLFNFFIGIINGNLVTLLIYNTIFYAAAALLLIVLNPKNVLYGKGAADCDGTCERSSYDNS